MKKQQNTLHHGKLTKRKNSDEEEYDSDQAYLERYKKKQGGNSQRKNSFSEIFDDDVGR